jgi:lysyl-tRNA synthetase class 2
MELGNAYSELTDPVEQLNRLQQQREFEQGEDYESHPIDADFVKAIGCGMPPTGGVGLGVDRLIMLLTDAASIRDIIPFPMVKPRQ